MQEIEPERMTGRELMALFDRPSASPTAQVEAANEELRGVVRYCLTRGKPSPWLHPPRQWS